jgi:hypothetical protein
LKFCCHPGIKTNCITITITLTLKLAPDPRYAFVMAFAGVQLKSKIEATAIYWLKVFIVRKI